MVVYISQLIERLEKHPHERHSLYVEGNINRLKNDLSKIEGVEFKIVPLDKGYDLIINGDKNA